MKDVSACKLLSRTLSETFSLLSGQLNYEYEFIEQKLFENANVIYNTAQSCLDDHEYKLLKSVIDHVVANIRARLSFTKPRATDEEILCSIKTLSDIIDNLIVQEG